MGSRRLGDSSSERNFFFFFSSRRRHTRSLRDWSSDVCSSDLGYVDPGHEQEAASHAWADVWIGGEGWVSVDVTHRVLARERHCRLAIGRDYLTAAPVRGVRTGGGDESMQVKVSVRSEHQ